MPLSLSDFDYDLPEDLIALRPATPRSAARLLVVTKDGRSDRTIADLPAALRRGDLLVFNDTKVIPARLTGARSRSTPDGMARARVEALLVERLGPARWRVLARPAKKLKPGDRLRFEATTGGDAALGATVVGRAEGAYGGGAVDLDFDASGPALDAAVAAVGAAPLPPYIAARRAPDAQDRDDYQSVFAEKDGAVAAPTASLHFDAALLAALAEAGVETTRVTLHVGAGTFLPIATDAVSEHEVHAELGEVGSVAAEAVARAKAEGRRVIPVGTTALRALETAAAAAPEGAPIAPWRGATDLFITPESPPRLADGLLTNFHLPKTTLLLLVAAMVGRERILSAYAHAVAQRYRFYSYGDACLLLP